MPPVKGEKEPQLTFPEGWTLGQNFCYHSRCESGMTPSAALTEVLNMTPEAVELEFTLSMQLAGNNMFLGFMS